MNLKAGGPHKKQRVGNGSSPHPPLPPSPPPTRTPLLLPAHLTHPSLLQLFLSFSIHLVAPTVPDRTNLSSQEGVGSINITQFQSSGQIIQLAQMRSDLRPQSINHGWAGLGNAKAALRPSCGCVGSFSENT